MSNSTNTIVHFEERRQFMFTDADKVIHNLCDVDGHSIFHIIKFYNVFSLKLKINRQGMIFAYQILKLCVQSKKWRSVH